MSSHNSESGPWGHKYEVSVYFAGPPDEEIDRAMQEWFALSPWCATFVGASVETVDQRPEDQAAA